MPGAGLRHAGRLRRSVLIVVALFIVAAAWPVTDANWQGGTPSPGGCAYQTTDRVPLGALAIWFFSDDDPIAYDRGQRQFRCT